VEFISEIAAGGVRVIASRFIYLVFFLFYLIFFHLFLLLIGFLSCHAAVVIGRVQIKNQLLNRNRK
jgi:hypothetical protein